MCAIYTGSCKMLCILLRSVAGTGRGVARQHQRLSVYSSVVAVAVCRLTIKWQRNNRIQQQEEECESAAARWQLKFLFATRVTRRVCAIWETDRRQKSQQQQQQREQSIVKSRQSSAILVAQLTERDSLMGQWDSRSDCKSNKSRHVLAFVLGNNLCHNAEATLQIPQKYIEMGLKMAIYALLGTGQICCRRGSHTPDAGRVPFFSRSLLSVSLCVVLAFLFMLT